MQDKLQIRLAAVGDASALLEIYAPYVTDTAITFEYDIPSLEEFENRMQTIQAKYPYLVAVVDDEIIGYAYATAFHPRAAYGRCVEMAIYLKMDKRQQGIGKKLYEELEARLKEMGILNLYACIGYAPVEDEYLTNVSVKFHEKMGYKVNGYFTKCGYKFGRWYDMVWMEKMIGEHI
jgi:phosphinothricin acetyltransferase